MISPPNSAEVWLMSEALFVVTDGIFALDVVVKFLTLPKLVPTLLVAKALK